MPGAQVAPEVLTVGRLGAYNDGPGKLRAEVSCRLSSAPVLAVKAQMVVLKVDWQFADQSTVRTLTSTFSATVAVSPAAGAPVTGEQSREVTSGVSPRVLARDAAALEIPLDLPEGVGLLRCEIGLRVVAVSHLSKQDSGWRHFPAVIVRADLCAEPVTPDVIAAVALAYGHLTCLNGGWQAETRQYWLTADTGSLLRNCSETPGDGRSEPPAEAFATDESAVAAALGSLADLFRPIDRPSLAERLAKAAALLRLCAARRPGTAPLKIAEELRRAAAGLCALHDRLPTQAEAHPSAALVTVPGPAQPPAPSPPLQPLRNGDFAEGLRFWQPTGDAASEPATVSVDVQSGDADEPPRFCLSRAEGLFALGSGGVAQEVSVPVPEGSTVCLEAQVLVESHSPAGGGSLGTVFPLRLSVEYLAPDGARHTFSHAFYAVGQAVRSGGATKVPPGAWHQYRSPAFATLTPRPATLVRVEISGGGRSFRAAVSRLGLR